MYDPVLVLASFWLDYFWWFMAPLGLMVAVAIFFDESVLPGSEDR